MFARTARLTLRPAWPEDAAALSHAIGHEQVVKMLSHVPWPYSLDDAREFLARPRSGTDAFFLILSHEADYPRLVGGMGFAPAATGGHEFGYWFTPDAWGRGYATEAGRSVVAIARHALGLKQLRAGHFVDNPASGRVLTKLGFRPTGTVEPRHSRARGTEAPCAVFELDLDEDPMCEVRLAA